MERKHGPSVIVVALLLLSAAPGAAAQTPAKPSPRPTVLEVTWELTVSGYECQARIVLQGSYEVHPWKEFTGGGEWGEARPDVVCGGAAATRCFVLKYCGGRLLSGSGKNSTGDTALFTETATTEGHPYGPEGLIRPTRDGDIEIVFYRQPGFQADNAAAEEALGCWSKDWPVAKLSDANVRDLRALQRHWETTAADAELMTTSPGCKPGQAKIDIRAMSSQSCDLLQSACQQTRSWLACVRQELADLGRSVAQARLEATAESATDQNPEARGYTPLLSALDRLQQAILDLQVRLATTEVTVAADCGLLPGPEDEKKCQGAAKQVDDKLGQARARMKLDLEIQTDAFERSTVPAVSFMARNKLMAQLRATAGLVGACYIPVPAGTCLPR